MLVEALVVLGQTGDLLHELVDLGYRSIFVLAKAGVGFSDRLCLILQEGAELLDILVSDQVEQRVA